MVPVPASPRPLRSELSAGNTVRSSTSLLLAVSELQSRRQMLTFTPTPELSDQGPSPSVPLLKERSHLPVTTESAVDRVACPPTCPHLPCVPHWPPCWACLQNSRSICWKSARGEEEYRTGVADWWPDDIIWAINVL